MLKKEDLLRKVILTIMSMEKKLKKKQFSIRDIINEVNDERLTITNYKTQLFMLTNSNIIKTYRDHLQLNIKDEEREEILTKFSSE